MMTERRVSYMKDASTGGVGVTLIERPIGGRGGHKAAVLDDPLGGDRLRMTDAQQAVSNGKQATARTLRISFASSERTQRDAGQLVRAQYARQGYMTQDTPLSGERFTLLAYHGQQLVGTLSVALDASTGLRGDGLFKPELDALRHNGRRICEFTRFAVDPSIHSFAVLAALFHTSYLLAYCLFKVDDVVAEVNPRHTRFYMGCLGFQQLADERMDPAVNAPAVLLRSRFSDIEHRILAVQSDQARGGREEGFFRYGFARNEEQLILKRLAAALQLPNQACILSQLNVPLVACA